MRINTSKVKPYIGFAIKSRKIKFGVDDIVKLKTVSLILASDSLSESGLKKLTGFASKKNLGVELIDAKDFEELFQNINIKATAILDDNLAGAIKKNLAI